MALWLSFSITAAEAFEFLPGLTNPATPTAANPFDQPVATPVVTPVAYEQSCGAQPYCDTCTGCGCDSCGCGVPVSWISGPYLKAGTAATISGGIFDDNHTPGYTISGGYRQPFGPFAPEHLFFDVGGSYMSVFGETRRFVNAIDLDVDIFGRETRTFVPNGQFSTLNEIQRSGAHVALGWYLGDPVDNPASDPQFRLALRGGARVSSFRGKFDNVPGPEISLFDQTDVGGGVFLGAESILLFERSRYCDVKWTLDAEFANDWVSFTQYTSGNLTTASIMLGFMLSR